MVRDTGWGVTQIWVHPPSQPPRNSVARPTCLTSPLMSGRNHNPFRINPFRERVGRSHISHRTCGDLNLNKGQSRAWSFLGLKRGPQPWASGRRQAPDPSTDGFPSAHVLHEGQVGADTVLFLRFHSLDLGGSEIEVLMNQV